MYRALFYFCDTLYRKSKGFDYQRGTNPVIDVSDDNSLDNQEFQEALRYIELAERDPMSFPSLPVS